MKTLLLTSKSGAFFLPLNKFSSVMLLLGMYNLIRSTVHFSRILFEYMKTGSVMFVRSLTSMVNFRHILVVR